MRRIPKIRRPSGSASVAVKQPIASFPCQRAATFTQTTTAPRTPATTTIRAPGQSVSSIHFTRLYSTHVEKSHIPQSLATGEELDGASLAPYVAPPSRTEAVRSDEVSDTNYAPATTSKGLETVGGLEGWWESPDHWRRDFEGFRARRKVMHPAVLEAAARRAVVEALALKHAGKEAELISVWPPATPGDVVDIHGTLTVDLRADANGSVQLTGDVTGVLRSLDWELASQGPNIADVEAGEVVEFPATTGKVPKSIFSPAEIEELRETWDKSWKLVPLVDPRLKFAITKRIFQLTGHLIPDHRLSEITNVQSLLRVLQKPPKPQTLTEEILKRDLKLRQQQQQQQQQEEGQKEAETQQAEGQQQQQQKPLELTQLPNVTFVPRRVTRGDRETAVGRYKLIEAEFRKRDLPVHGHGYARKNKERTWLRGGV